LGGQGAWGKGRQENESGKDCKKKMEENHFREDFLFVFAFAFLFAQTSM